MAIYEQKFSVDYAFDVYFTRDLFSTKNEILSKVIGDKKKKVLTVVDENLLSNTPGLKEKIEAWFKAHEKIVENIGIESVPGGEVIKNDLEVVDRLGRLSIEKGICRHSYIMVIGGGAVLDAVGYAASIIHRGVRLIRVPTTVLAQNDSAVGVKNGVNRFGVKNFYGVFSPPGAVINDYDFLASLPQRVWISGVSEAFKVATIKDKTFLNYLINNTDALRKRHRTAEEKMIRRGAILHLEHIGKGGDPFERGSSRPLDFGHWSAHKLESLTNFDVLHGEAVSIGVAVDLHYAALKGFIKESDARRIIMAMLAIGLPVFHPYMIEKFDQIMIGLDEFREHLGGELTVAMPDGIGNRLDVHEMDRDLIRQAIEMTSQYCIDGEPIKKLG